MEGLHAGFDQKNHEISLFIRTYIRRNVVELWSTGSPLTRPTSAPEDREHKHMEQGSLFGRHLPPLKRCSGCKNWLPLEAFNRRTTAPDGRQWNCRECNSRWHAENKPRHNAMIQARNKRVRQELTQKVLDYLLDHPCVDCGETDPVVLDFDHLRDKVNAVSLMAGRAIASWERIQTEIAKCEVRCANCHRRATARRAMTFRYRATRGILEGG